MKKESLIFATSNNHKLQEISEMLEGLYTIVGMKDIGCTEDIPETHATFTGNALQKARYLQQHYNYDCIAEDTGLEISYLNGEPGVFSARYAGDQRDAEANMEKVLSQMTGTTIREAQFKTVIALLLNGEEFIFEGVTKGVITKEKSGEGGFGYDPIFKPLGFDITFAEMDSATKNKISHRGKAVKKLIEFLKDK